jgi:hypothetical protein
MVVESSSTQDSVTLSTAHCDSGHGQLSHFATPITNSTVPPTPATLSRVSTIPSAELLGTSTTQNSVMLVTAHTDYGQSREPSQLFPFLIHTAP